jgi:hypothetical protein
MIKRPNLIIYDIEEGAELQAKSIKNLLNEIIANFSNQGKNMDIQGEDEPQIDMIRKDPFHVTL